MAKIQFEGVVKEAIQDILNSQGVSNVDSANIKFDLETLQKGTHRRTNAYRITVTSPQEIAEFELFCKEYVREGHSPDLTGREKSDIHEEEISSTLRKIGGFAPMPYGIKAFMDDNGCTHSLKFSELFHFNLEDKLDELYNKKVEAQSMNDSDSVTKIENDAGDLIRRFSDVIMVNNYLLNEKCRHEEIIGSLDKDSDEPPKVRIFKPVTFANKLIDYFETFLKAMIPKETDRRAWQVKYKYYEIMRIFVEEVANYFANQAEDSTQKVSLFGPYPGHCLYKSSVDLSDPKYDDSASILTIRDGQKKDEKTPTPYTGFAICDLTKIGTYHSIFGLASLYTSPAVIQLLPKEKIKPRIETEIKEGGLTDHLLVAERKLASNKNCFLDDIHEKDQRKFLEIFSRGSIWTFMRPLSYISSMTPEEQKELTKMRPICNPPEKFARLCINGIIDIYDPAGNFSALRFAMEDLNKALNNHPFSSRYN